jgi:hypothetical protein
LSYTTQRRHEEEEGLSEEEMKRGEKEDRNPSLPAKISPFFTKNLKQRKLTNVRLTWNT